MADFSRWQTDVLFLLVGENPLPNYVAAKLLLRESGVLYLVHSEGLEGTGGVAQRLADRLPQFRTHLVSVDPMGAKGISDAVTTHLEQTTSGFQVGLNYTGGTKFMAVHTYQAVEEFCKKRGRSVVLSYLHASTLELTVESRPGVPAMQQPAAQSVPLAFEDVFALHGLKRTDADDGELRFPQLARALATMHGSSKGVDDWKTGMKMLQEQEGESWVLVSQHLYEKGVSTAVVDALATCLGMAGNEPLDLEGVAQRVGLSSRGSLLNWLAWEWLEDWTLVCVRDLVSEPDLGYGSPVKGLKGVVVSGGYGFQIDVAVMRGYQLFVFSCKATTVRKLAKLGLMEAYARARQMGGEEARAILVTTYDKPDGLKSEFAGDWGADQRVRVYGCAHLPDLKDHLRDLFEHP